MIVSRAPVRFSLGGGGTDLPSYYEKFGGFLIAAAIDRYVYVTINRPLGAGIRLKYSDIENVDTVDEVRHPIIREALRMMNLRTPQIEITTLAEIPSGTGLARPLSAEEFALGPGGAGRPGAPLDAEGIAGTDRAESGACFTVGPASGK